MIYIDYIKLGKRIRFFRRQKGKTQEDLADLLDASAAYISNIERGIKRPSLQKLMEISYHLGTTLNDLIPIEYDEYDNLIDFESIVKQYPEPIRRQLLLCLAEIISIIAANN